MVSKRTSEPPLLLLLVLMLWCFLSLAFSVAPVRALRFSRCPALVFRLALVLAAADLPTTVVSFSFVLQLTVSG